MDEKEKAKFREMTQEKRENVLKRAIVRLHDILGQLEEQLEIETNLAQKCIEFLEYEQTREKAEK